MKGRLVVLIGCSGSGKSTYAHNMWHLLDDIRIVSRDAIRCLLFGYNDHNIAGYYDRTDLAKLEKEVTKYEDTIIYEGLEAGKTVVVDSTNLTRKYLKRYEYWNVPIEFVTFYTPLEECYLRDASRVREVGKKFIDKQWAKFSNLGDVEDFEPIEFVNDISYPKCFVFDIDGTLAKKSDRSAYDWSRVGEDTVIESVKSALISARETNIPIILCSGRDGVCFKETVDWLSRNDLNCRGVMLRKEGDMRPDWVVKEEMWRIIVAKKYYISAIYDDRLQVVRRARALGLTVFNVAYNNF